MQIKRFRQRATLGVRYVKEYVLDEVSDPYNRTYLLPKPLDVICEISYLCNLECPTCFRWTSKPDEHELTAEEWKGVLAKLKDWLGTFNLTFTGGSRFSGRISWRSSNLPHRTASSLKSCPTAHSSTKLWRRESLRQAWMD